MNYNKLLNAHLKTLINEKEAKLILLKEEKTRVEENIEKKKTELETLTDLLDELEKNKNKIENIIFNLKNLKYRFKHLREESTILVIFVIILNIIISFIIKNALDPLIPIASFKHFAFAFGNISALPIIINNIIQYIKALNYKKRNNLEENENELQTKKLEIEEKKEKSNDLEKTLNGLNERKDQISNEISTVEIEVNVLGELSKRMFPDVLQNTQEYTQEDNFSRTREKK